jgi:N-acyl-D-amino-acid deacylase
VLAGCTNFWSPAPYDLVIRGGRVIDGSGRPAITADVAVRDGRIAAVGAVSGRGCTEIDAAGKVVAPGFIDVHTHSEDITELPFGENFLRMGVTTIVSGNCGSSKLDIAGYFDGIAKTQVAVNVATLVGQGSVRRHVMGNADRKATPEELDKMRQLVDRAMKDGAVGMSTGLIYLPGSFTPTSEIVELAKVAAAHGGLYASHMRSEGTGIFSALGEVTQVAREARIRAEVSHIKLSSPAAWGRTADVVALLDRARAEGLDIRQDQYVYTASSTGISQLVPDDALAGGTAAFRASLKNPAKKAQIVAAMKNQIERGKRGDYSYAVIANYRADPKLNGRSIPEAAQIMRGARTLDDQIETVLEILANGGASGVFHGINEADLQQFLVLPLTMVASDAGPRKFGDGVPHPRGYGNNARVLARYVRELKLLPLEEAVRKMTSLPAQTFRLGKRGELRLDFAADLVVFDPAKVDAPSTFTDPHHYAVGFNDVIVNGTPVIRDGQLTGAKPGRPVRLTDQ